MREAVSQALFHSLATANQYYRTPTMSDANKYYKVIWEMIRGTRASRSLAAARARRRRGRSLPVLWRKRRRRR